MKTLLKNYTFYFWLFAVISILLSFYLYHKYSYTNHRLNQVEGILQLQKSIMRPEDVASSEAVIKIDSLSRLLEVQELKEEYYLNQLDTLSDWFILYVTGLTALFGFVGFSTLKTLEERVTLQEKSNKEQFEKFEKELLEFDLVNEVMLGNIYVVSGDASIKIKDYPNAFFHKLLSIQCFIKGQQEETQVNIQFLINTQITQILSFLEKVDFNEYDARMNEDIDEAFAVIMRLNHDKEIRSKIMDINLKVKELRMKRT